MSDDQWSTTALWTAVNVTGDDSPAVVQGGAVDASLTAVVTAAAEAPPRATQLSVVQTVVLSVMFVVALVGNSATLARMYRMRRRRSTINLLITHLATADLVVTFFCNVTEAVWTSTVQWLAGNAACKLIKFLQVDSMHASDMLCYYDASDRYRALSNAAAICPSVSLSCLLFQNGAFKG